MSNKSVWSDRPTTFDACGPKPKIGTWVPVCAWETP